MARITDEMTLNGFTSGTTSNQKSTWRNYTAACALYHWQPVPTNQETLRKYTTHVFATETIIGSTMVNRIDNIRAIHILLEYPVDMSKAAMPLLALQLRAFKRARPSKQNVKVALGGQLMSRMLHHLSTRCHDQQTIRAMMAFAYGGMLRVSEYSYGANTKNRPRWSSIIGLSQQQLTFAFYHSKT